MTLFYIGKYLPGMQINLRQNRYGAMANVFIVMPGRSVLAWGRR